MKILILTAPTGAGKNIISEILAKKREHCVVIDFDVLRNMIRNPHKAPWEGEEGQRQNDLNVKNASQLAKNYVTAGFDVIILDVLTNESAVLYRKELQEYNPKIVLLLPTFEEVKRRNTTRPPRLTDTELEMVYQWEENLTVFDEKIDNTTLTPEEVAEQLQSFF